MKLFLKILIVILALLFCVGCNEKIGGYDHPTFVTNYTEEEHVERIRQRTAEKFEKEIVNQEIVDIHVEIIYAFYDNDPEYFLVEIEYAREWINAYKNPDYSSSDESSQEYIEYTTKYKHLIGFIENDKYKTGLMYYDSFIDGRSSYSFYGYRSAKKYYGGLCQAVEIDGQIIELSNGECLRDGIIENHSHYSFYECTMGRVIKESEYEKLMKSNYKLFKFAY